MDEAEVERVAKLMHQTAIDWHKQFGPIEAKIVSRPWQDILPLHRERYRFAARAVLADLCLSPFVVVTGR